MKSIDRNSENISRVSDDIRRSGIFITGKTKGKTARMGKNWKTKVVIISPNLLTESYKHKINTKQNKCK